MESVEKILAGDIRTAAKLIRDIDDGIPSSREALKALYPHTGRAYVIGISGFPGVGKSTLADQMIRAYREAGKNLGVLAIDPTSPFSGGAILGDRIRMQGHGTDPGVFIRSLATRGYFGGLTRSTRSVIDVLDAMGKDIILVETVGVGQDEVDIVTTAHTTVIVLIPGMGDDIQAIKAGILEVADIFVINKADREGLEKTMNELRAMLDMNAEGSGGGKWRPPIVATEAVRNRGVPELLSNIKTHKAFLFDHATTHLRKHLRKKAFRELVDTIKDTFVSQMIHELEGSEEFEQMIDDLVEKRIDPFSLCQQIMTKRSRKEVSMPKRKDTKSVPVGEKIKKVRKKKKISLDQVANDTGCSIDYLKQIEANKVIPAVGTLLQISRALEIDSGFLLRERESTVERRVKAYTKRTENYAYTTLTPGAENKHLKAFRVTVDAMKEHKGVGYQHEGEEFVYVLVGQIEVTVGDHVNRLKEGESLHFNSGIRHKLRNIGDKKADLLVVIYTP